MVQLTLEQAIRALQDQRRMNYRYRQRRIMNDYQNRRDRFMYNYNRPFNRFVRGAGRVYDFGRKYWRFVGPTSLYGIYAAGNKIYGDYKRWKYRLNPRFYRGDVPMKAKSFGNVKTRAQENRYSSD